MPLMVNFRFLIFILFDICIPKIPAKIEHSPLTIIRCVAMPGLGGECGNSQYTTFYLP